MDDAVLVGVLQCVRNLTRYREGLVQRYRSLGNPVGERRTFDELHDERLAFGESVDTCNVRMVERGEDLRLALEAGEPVGIRGEVLRQHLEGDVPVERRIVRPIHLAHPPCADQGGDFIGAESSADFQRHVQ
jgi:hypothetical protein